MNKNTHQTRTVNSPIPNLLKQPGQRYSYLLAILELDKNMKARKAKAI